MMSDEIVRFLAANSGRKLRLVEWGNTDPQLIQLLHIDDEGFSYVLTDPISYAPAGTKCWTQVEQAIDLQTADETN
jgi:hypothetical protein